MRQRQSSAGMPPTDEAPFIAAPELAPAEVAELARRLDRALAPGRRYRYRYIHPDGKARRRLPLPWKARARLRAQGAVDTACIWLCYHGHGDAAMRIWEACGMVGRR